MLSPFVVQTSTNTGYEASESLAGTGLRTKLTDLGASVSVITSKFLEDTGSKNLSDALVYQANMEVRGFGGNYSGVTPSGGGIVNEPSLGNGPTGTRVRGLAEATQARNFYRSIIPMDGYNTDRVEINRGANALLFGVGSPAGIINSSTLAADLQRSRGEVRLSAGSWGSYRAMLDYNSVASRGNLAIRVAAVKDDEKYQQKFAFTDTERKYVTASWDIAPLRNRGILDSTVVHASYERGRIVSNNPRVLPPSDRLSPWFEATLSDELKALGARPKATYDPGVLPGIFTAAAGTGTISTVANVNRSATFTFQDPYATAPRDNTPLSPTGQTVLGRAMVSNNVYFPWSGLTNTAQHAYVRPMSTIRTIYSIPDAEYFTAENLTDRTVFDFFNQLLVGPNSRQSSRLESLDVSVQQLLLRQTAGVELAFNRQRWRESLQNLIVESEPWISIDVNTRMWTGEANPNFGRPFTSTAGNASYSQQEIETSRAKVFYELNLQEKMSGRLGSTLGKHVFSLLAQREELTTRAHSGGRLFYTPDVWVNGNNQSRLAPPEQTARGLGLSWPLDGQRHHTIGREPSRPAAKSDEFPRGGERQGCRPYPNPRALCRRRTAASIRPFLYPDRPPTRKRTRYQHRQFRRAQSSPTGLPSIFSSEQLAHRSPRLHRWLAQGEVLDPWHQRTDHHQRRRVRTGRRSFLLDRQSDDHSTGLRRDALRVERGRQDTAEVDATRSASHRPERLLRRV